MTRRQQPKTLKRRTATRPERKTVVIFCEGEASEPDYINGLKRLPEVQQNTAINIEIAPDQGVPLTLVKRAIERAADNEVDECWCVFDVEWPQHHPHLADAIARATQHGVRLAISNPCFELWLILHFKDHGAFLDTRKAEQLSRTLDGRSGKRIDATKYLALRADASRRAKMLAGRHQSAGTSAPDDNPSSGMFGLLAAIEPPSRH